MILKWKWNNQKTVKLQDMQKNDLDPPIIVDPFTKHLAHTLGGGGERERDNVRERERDFSGRIFWCLQGI